MKLSCCCFESYPKPFGTAELQHSLIVLLVTTLLLMCSWHMIKQFAPYHHTQSFEAARVLVLTPSAFDLLDCSTAFKGAMNISSAMTAPAAGQMWFMKIYKKSILAF
jgi:hypothetical protein